MILTVGSRQIILEWVGHRGFGIILPNPSVSSSRLMIAVWWCLSVRVNSIKRVEVESYAVD